MGFLKHMSNKFIWVLVLIGITASAATPDMGLVLPSVGVTTGPQWATLLNTALTTIDSHDHTSGKGVQITPNAININSNLSFGGNSATSLLASSYSNTSAHNATAGSIEQYLTDLWFIDGNSNQVQITSSGKLNASALAANSIAATKISSGAAASGTALVSNGSGGSSFSSISFSVAIATKTANYQLTNADGTILANCTSGSFHIKMPDPTANTGKIFFLKRIDASGNVITVLPFSSETFDGAASMTIQVQYETLGLQTDGANWYQLF